MNFMIPYQQCHPIHICLLESYYFLKINQGFL